jgi:hypothetical protein
MSIGGIILGLINIAIVVVLLLLVGAVALWLLSYLHWTPPDNVQKLYIAFVALVGLYMLVALIFGLPSVHVIGSPPGPMIR